MKSVLPEFNESQLIAIDTNSISEFIQTKKTEGRCGGTRLRFNVSDIKQIKKHIDSKNN